MSHRYSYSFLCPFHSGNFVLGFRLDSPQKLADVHKEVRVLHEIYYNNPNFGVSFELEERPTTVEAGAQYVSSSSVARGIGKDSGGVSSSSTGPSSPVGSTRSPATVDDDVQVLDYDDHTHFDTLAAYYADAGSSQADSMTSRVPVYNDELGLAIEKPRDGLSLHELWQVQST